MPSFHALPLVVSHCMCFRTHIKCGEVAPMDCGIRPARPRVPQTFPPGSPLSKAKQVAGRSAANSPAASPRRF